MDGRSSDVRFDRMARTEWVNMESIHSARVFVAGAGALGNEVLKDLVLAGFRHIAVADPDTVEESNLSRCILFRTGDIGYNKAEIAAAYAVSIDPDCSVNFYAEKIQGLDLSGYDLLIGCLDSISARLHLNSYARYRGIPYVDGATDGFRGKVQTVLRTGPCMECSMNRTHVNELHRTFSCDPMKNGIVPDPVILSSGITTTSIIAGACVREAIKIVCGKEELCVPGISYYDGILGTMEPLGLEISPECPNHEGEL